MFRFLKSVFLITLPFILYISSCINFGPDIKFYYLGHSSVFINFNGKVSVLCDYGMENAYLEWGWDSPIYDAGEPGPDIITYSHTHDDHFDEKRAAEYKAIRIQGEIDTTINKLHIKSFKSSEKDISAYDNNSYLFTYKGLKVLHLGDCQADIMMINDPAQAWNIEQRYPKGCDILIMPIEGTQQYILQAIKMVELLEPKVLIPTHYWSHGYKLEFLEEIERQFLEKEQNINIIGLNTSIFTYRKKGMNSGLTIPSLIPTARKMN